MKPIDLSIIIVNFQSWDYLNNCLLSFKKYPPSVSYEIIVIDNDSQDEKFNHFQVQHSDVFFHENKGNYGFSHGCNLGATFAKGDYLLFLNPDTELTNDHSIDNMLDYLHSNSEIGIVSCRNVTPQGKGKELRFVSPWMLFGFIRFFHRLIYKNEILKQSPPYSDVHFPEWVTGSVIMIKKQLFNKINRWNEERYWMYSEDPDLCMKVKKQGKKIALLTNLTIKHVEGGASKPSIHSKIRYKTEDTISKHNYIQENSTSYSRSILHFLYFIKIQFYILLIILNRI